MLKNVAYSSILLSTIALLTACGGGGGADGVIGSDSPGADNTSAPAGAATEPGLYAAKSWKRKTSTSTTPTTTTTTSTATTTLQKGMWSWRDSDVTNSTARQQLLDFAAANKITVLYIHSEGLLKNSPQLLADFINLAAAKNIAVELLFGATEWTFTANHQIAVDLLQRANTFVNGLSGAKPIGVQFDVEPHSLSGWATNQADYGSQLIDLYAKLKQAKLPGLYLNADIAMGYEYINITRNGVTKTLSQWLIDVTDRTTLMAYRDYATGADSITDHANHPVSYAASTGKISYVGVETTCGLDPEKITFCEEGKAALESSLGSVTSYYSGNRGYGGNAVHDYTAYMQLR